MFGHSGKVIAMFKNWRLNVLKPQENEAESKPILKMDSQFQTCSMLKSGFKKIPNETKPSKVANLAIFGDFAKEEWREKRPNSRLDG